MVWEFYGKAGQEYDLVVEQEPEADVLGFLRDERDWLVRVRAEADGSATVLSGSFTWSDGKAFGPQDGFLLRTPVQGSVWTEEEKAAARKLMEGVLAFRGEPWYNKSDKSGGKGKGVVPMC